MIVVKLMESCFGSSALSALEIVFKGPLICTSVHSASDMNLLHACFKGVMFKLGYIVTTCQISQKECKEIA